MHQEWCDRTVPALSIPGLDGLADRRDVRSMTGPAMLRRAHANNSSRHARAYFGIRMPGIHIPGRPCIAPSDGCKRRSGGIRRGPNARIKAATHPIPVGAPIRSTRNTRASRSTPRITPISVGSGYAQARTELPGQTVRAPRRWHAASVWCCRAADLSEASLRLRRSTALLSDRNSQGRTLAESPY